MAQYWTEFRSGLNMDDSAYSFAGYLKAVGIDLMFPGPRTEFETTYWKVDDENAPGMFQDKTVVVTFGTGPEGAFVKDRRIVA